MVNPFYKPQILKWIKKMFTHAEKSEWFETYWAVDLHGTIIKPSYKGTEMTYYPYAKETMKLLSERKDIKLILWTSSFPNEIEEYVNNMKTDGILFDSINENPGVSSKNGSFGYYEDKFYFNVLFDDKSGFDAERDWKSIYKYFKKTKYRPNSNWSFKVMESYHSKNPK